MIEPNQIKGTVKQTLEQDINFLGAYKEFDLVIGSTEYTFAHNLDKYPEAIFVRNDGRQMMAAINYLDRNTVYIRLEIPVEGKVIFK